MNRERWFEKSYISENGVCCFKEGQKSIIIHFYGVTDVDVVVGEEIYTLPLDDYMRCTTQRRPTSRAVDATPTSAADSESNNGVRR